MNLRLFIVALAGVLLVALASFFRSEQPKPGETPLMLAANRGDAQLVKSLIQQGADAHAVTPDGRNAMDYAMLGGVCQVQTVIALREKVPDLQFHEPSPLLRNLEVAKLKGCVVLSRVTHLW